MKEIKVSVASYSFHKLIQEGTLNVFGYLDLLKYRYHVNWADIWTAGCIKTFDESYLRSVRRYMDERELQLANLCIDGPHVWMDDVNERAEHKQTMLQWLKAAEILGAKTVRIDFGGPNVWGKQMTHEEMYSMTDEAFEYIVKTFQEYCGIVDAFGCKIGPENHWGWDRVPTYLKKVHEAVAHKAYGHLYHLYNFFDEPEAGEEFCIAHAMHTHVHAWAFPTAKETIRKLLHAGYEGTVGLEHHSGEFEEERVEWQLGTIRAILAELRGTDLSVPAPKDFMTEMYAGKQPF